MFFLCVVPVVLVVIVVLVVLVELGVLEVLVLGKKWSAKSSCHNSEPSKHCIGSK